MKEKIKTLFSIMIIVVLLPILLTLFLQKDVLFPERGLGETDGEEITQALLGMLAQEIPVNYEKEAIKAQAVIARTNYYHAQNEGMELPDSLNSSEMMQLYGKESYQECINRLEECIRATDGQVIAYENKLVEVPYFRVSAGSTRDAGETFAEEDLGYLKGVESVEDIQSEDYLKVTFYEPQELLRLCGEAFPAAGLAESEDVVSLLTVGERDAAGYVRTMKVGTLDTSGEDFRNKLQLNSACFSIKQVDDRVRIVTKGLGHGVGLSQYGANALAAEGQTYEEILKKFYSGIEIVNSSTL